MKDSSLQENSSIVKNVFNKVRNSNVFLALVGLLLISLSLSIMSPYFLTVSNILNVLRQISTIAVVSIGMTYVIITGGIDLSVGSVLALSAVVTAYLMTHGFNMYLSIIIGMIIGLLCGFLNGIFIATKINMPPFIVTLAMMGIARGLSLVIADGKPIYGLPEQFGYIAGGYVFGIPIPVIIIIFLYVLGYIHLSFTKTGVYFYAVGGNQEATRVAGVDIRRVKLDAYVISGLAASIGGVILSSRLVSVEPLSGAGYELDALAAAVIGGANLVGGEGSLVGTLIGAVVMGVLRNGLNLLNVSAYWQQVAVGVVIIVVVLTKSLRRK